MPSLSGLFKKGDKVSPTTLLSLTPAGKGTAENMNESGIKLYILDTLSQKGAMTINGLARELQVPINTVGVAVRQLIDSSMINPVGGQG